MGRLVWSLKLETYRRELVLVEEVLRPRLEFWDEIRRMFSLGDALRPQRLLFRAPSGGLYDVVFIDRRARPPAFRTGSSASSWAAWRATCAGFCARTGPIGCRAIGCGEIVLMNRRQMMTTLAGGIVAAGYGRSRGYVRVS